MKRIILLIILSFGILLTSCNLPKTRQAYIAGNSEPQAWIDAPLNESYLPLASYEVVYHITAQGGVALGELSINDKVVASSSNPDPTKNLVTLKYQWDPPAPGKYLLNVRAQGSDGGWGADTRSVVYVGEGTATITPTLMDTPSLTSTPTTTTTATPTSTLAAGFSNFSAMPNAVYYGNCTPNQVNVNAQAFDPAGINTVVLFYRLREDNGNKTEWLNVAMNSNSNDQYSKTLDLGSANFLAKNGTLDIQLVIQNQNGEMVRSQVYSDVSVSACTPFFIVPEIKTKTPFFIVPVIKTKTPIIIK